MGPTARLLRLVALAAAALLFTGSSAPFSAASAPQQDAAARCVAAIVSISPCLAHVAAVAPLAGAPPAPTDACCVAFLRAVAPGGGGEGCLCHLLRDPRLLGFPVDATRLAALLPACAAGNAFAAATVEAAALFADACRELKALPELHITPLSAIRPEISPVAAVTDESVSKQTAEAVPPAAPMVRSGAEGLSSSSEILLAALILAAAGAVIT